MTIASSQKDDVYFAARMTNIQFEALACRLEPLRMAGQVREHLASRSLRRGQQANVNEISKWLVNGWSTERLLRTNAIMLKGDALRHSLHWAFPQAYYAVFAVTQAYFRSVGYTESAHTSTIRKFGMEAKAGRYPAVLCCYADGRSPKGFAGLSPTKLPHSLHFDPDDAATVDGQIAQFLSATRNLDLDSRKGDFKFKNKNGTRKKALRLADWEKVSQGLGSTSLLSLLYRKRIKANYRDIDTFLHHELDPEKLYRDLLQVVSAFNVTHEALIGAVIGVEWLRGVIDSVPSSVGERPRRRMAAVRAASA